jgi:hypothetical protein
MASSLTLEQTVRTATIVPKKLNFQADIPKEWNYL